MNDFEKQLIVFIKACLDDDEGISDKASDKLYALKDCSHPKLKRQIEEILNNCDGTNNRFYLT